MNKELVDYIKQQTEINVSKNEITDILLQQGWHQSEIDEAFAQAVVEFGAGQSDFNAKEFNMPVGEQGGGIGKKMLLFVLPIVLVLVLVAGAMILMPGQEPEEPATVVEDNSASLADPIVEQEAQTIIEEEKTNNPQADPALLAEIAEMEKTITPPIGWTSRQGMISYRPLAVFFKPEWEQDASGKNIFDENINIVRDVLSSTEADYLASAKAALQKNIENYKIISDRTVNLKSGAPATLIGGSFTQNGLAMKNMQLYAVNGNIIYIITGVTLASNWEAEKDMIGEAVMSFAFPAN